MEEMRDGELERSSRDGRSSSAAGSGDGAAESRERERADADSDEEVRRRAYELYVSRGGGPGSEVDDWLAAEREVRTARQAEPEVQGGAEKKAPRPSGRGRSRS
ncbi:MAG TPA: DUF2934 domain-containing protein [Gemmatimonadaceae bacterium]